MKKVKMRVLLGLEVNMDKVVLENKFLVNFCENIGNLSYKRMIDI